MKKTNMKKIETLTTGEIIPYGRCNKIDFQEGERALDITNELKIVKEFMFELFWCGNVSEQENFHALLNKITREKINSLVGHFEKVGLSIQDSAALLAATPTFDDGKFQNLLEFYQSEGHSVLFRPNFEENYIDALLDVDVVM